MLLSGHASQNVKCAVVPIARDAERDVCSFGFSAAISFRALLGLAATLATSKTGRFACFTMVYAPPAVAAADASAPFAPAPVAGPFLTSSGWRQPVLAGRQLQLESPFLVAIIIG